jgi:membrane protein DedA with SNARE-associated domain
MPTPIPVYVVGWVAHITDRLELAFWAALLVATVGVMLGAAAVFVLLTRR